MLGNLPIKNIPFDKKNTFCFDSESFRYLVAVKNGIDFDEYQKEEYEESWTTSVNESNRFLQYICGTLKTYPFIEWKSIDHAQFQINPMIRPILETMRNLFRNLILYEEKSSKRLINLCPTVISRSSAICLKCKSVPENHNEFWIFPNNVHIFLDKCHNCKCSREMHIDINYRLDYELSDNVNEQSIDKMKLKLNQLKKAILKFGSFFVDTTRQSKPNDPILSFLNRMIEEENQICEEKGNEVLNSILHKKLNQFREDYEQKQSESISKIKPINLTKIYELIDDVTKLDLIEKQIDAVKQYCQTSMDRQEKVLP